MRTGAREKKDAPAHDDLTTRQQQRRDRIVGAAVELLAEYDYDDVHMTLVAERAGVALGTLYRYFPSKERLFASSLLEWSQRFALRHERRALGTTGDARTRIKAVLGTAARAFERNPHFLKPVIMLQASDDDDVRSIYAEYSSTTTGVLRSELSTVPGLDVDTVELMLLASLTTLLRSWSAGHRSMRDVHRLLDAAVEAVVPVDV